MTENGEPRVDWNKQLNGIDFSRLPSATEIPPTTNFEWIKVPQEDKKPLGWNKDYILENILLCSSMTDQEIKVLELHFMHAMSDIFIVSNHFSVKFKGKKMTGIMVDYELETESLEAKESNRGITIYRNKRLKENDFRLGLYDIVAQVNHYLKYLEEPEIPQIDR